MIRMAGSLAIALSGGLVLTPSVSAKAPERKLPKHWCPEEIAELRIASEGRWKKPDFKQGSSP